MSEYIELKNVTGVFVNLTTKSIIVTGIPESDDESHNCDEMGCTSVEHTIYRFDAGTSEIQRLRAALEDIRYQIEQSNHPAGLGILATVNGALSTTTESKGDQP